MTKVIAVDFDGCICDDRYPEVGAPNAEVIQRLIDERTRGAKIILWTCRTGQMLEAAVSASEAFGLEFDAVNENLPEMIARYGGDTRKVCADEYWDDRAVVMPPPH